MKALKVWHPIEERPQKDGIIVLCNRKNQKLCRLMEINAESDLTGKGYKYWAYADSAYNSCRDEITKIRRNEHYCKRREKNKDRIAEYHREWCKKNKDRIAEYHREWSKRKRQAQGK